MQIYRFRNCLLNTSERTVIKDDDCLELTTRTFDVLQYLIENAGKVLTKDEILGNVWEGSFVEESNLPVHISKLRKVLGDSADNRLIETVQGTGYRFVAPVKLVHENDWNGATTSEYVFSTLDVQILSATSNALAVLPFENRSSDLGNEYLTDGMTEGLINELSRVPGLRVIARDTAFRCKSRTVDVRKVGSRLGVSMLVVGRLRSFKNQLTLSIELVSVEDGLQIWGGSFPLHLSNLSAMQRKIAHVITEQLALSVRQRAYSFGATLSRNSESYRLYLKGRYFLEKYSAADMNKAIGFFTQSTFLDPRNVFSYAEMVECYRLLYSFDYISYDEFLQNTSAILTAIGNCDQCVDVVQLVYCDLEMLQWRFDQAAEHCRKALSINPNSPRARLRYSDLLLQSRKFPEALEQMERSLKVDPLSEVVYSRIARTFYVMGRYDSALAYLNDALELEPNSYQALALRGAVHTELGRYESALDDFRASLSLHHNVETLAMIGAVYARLGRITEAREMIKRVEQESRGHSEHSIKLAHIYLALGQKSDTYDALERAYLQHESDLRALTYDPRWNSIRTEQSFQKLVERVGLPRVAEK